MIAFAVQKALFEAVSAAVAPVPVSDQAPRNQAYPLVHVGRVTGQPENTLDARQTRCLVTLTAWSDYAGKKQLAEIVGQISDALDDASLALDGAEAVTCFVDRWDIAEPDDEGSNLIRTASIIINILVEH